MRNFDVFVSHSSKDKPWVHRLVVDLARYGVSVWLDENEIRPGDLFVDALERGLEQSRTVALVVSPASLVSGWVKETYNRAVMLAQRKDHRLQLIPVLLHGAEMSGLLATRSWVDFRDVSQYAQSVWRLVWGITGKKPPYVLQLDANAPPLRPSKHIPEPAMLSAGSRTSEGRSLLVVRADDLRRLVRMLRAHNPAALDQTASGTLPGSGRKRVMIIAVAALATIMASILIMALKGNESEYSDIPVLEGLPLVSAADVGQQAKSHEPWPVQHIEVEVTSEPAGAQVFAQGSDEPLGVTPFTYKAPPSDGLITLRLELEGYKTIEISFRGDRNGLAQAALRKESKRDRRPLRDSRPDVQLGPH